MNFETARMAMVESQIRPNGVRDPRVLNAFASVSRECFVPEGQRALAYMDEAVLAAPATPHSPARYLLPPMVLARLLQFAQPFETARALDVGGATGYSAAILSKVCGTVHALEASELLAARTEQCLSHAAIDTVSVHHGALDGWVGRGKAVRPDFDERRRFERAERAARSARRGRASADDRPQGLARSRLPVHEGCGRCFGAAGFRCGR